MAQVATRPSARYPFLVVRDLDHVKMLSMREIKMLGGLNAMATLDIFKQNTYR